MQKLLRDSKNMPSDALTALLLKKPTVLESLEDVVASGAVVEGAQEHSPEAAADADPEVEGKANEGGVSSSKDRKRHRDGGSAKSHHKKAKKAAAKEAAAKGLSKDGVNVAADACFNSAPIKTCRSYAEKVLLSSYVTPLAKC